MNRHGESLTMAIHFSYTLRNFQVSCLAENITILFKSLKDDIFPIWFALTFISAVGNSL